MSIIADEALRKIRERVDHFKENKGDSWDVTCERAASACHDIELLLAEVALLKWKLHRERMVRVVVTPSCALNAISTFKDTFHMPTISKPNEAQALHAELAERMVHVEELIVGIKSNCGDYAVAMSPSLSTGTIIKTIGLLQAELDEREIT